MDRLKSIILFIHSLEIATLVNDTFPPMISGVIIRTNLLVVTFHLTKGKHIINFILFLHRRIWKDSSLAANVPALCCSVWDQVSGLPTCLPSYGTPWRLQYRAFHTECCGNGRKTLQTRAGCRRTSCFSPGSRSRISWVRIHTNAM